MTRLFLFLIGCTIFIYAALVLISPRTVPPPLADSATSTAVIAASTTVIAENLHVPWDIAFMPDSSLLVTERDGNIVHIDPTGSTTRIHMLQTAAGENGLLGIVLHPEFAQNKFVYLYMSIASGAGTTNSVVRFTYDKNVFTQAKVIIAGIPGALSHDGGRLEFGPDKKLYITTGDATHGELAQNIKSLAGKILRINDDGTIPADNPFANAVYSYGHRNPQGLAWDESGVLWETEHGPTGESGKCCHDEINKIEKGGNYGWPSIIGEATGTGLIAPLLNSGDDTWAPAGLLYTDGSLYFGALQGAGIYRATVATGTVSGLTKVLDATFGRIRTIRRGPDAMFYITTSNTDGRGRPLPGDDRIIRIDPRSFK